MYFHLFEDFTKDARYYRIVAKWWDAMTDDERWKILDNLGDKQSTNTLRVYGYEKYGAQHPSGKLGIQELYASRGTLLGKDLSITETNKIRE